MRTFKLNKLIRDKVLENMLQLGQDVQYKTLDDHDVIEALRQKLLEEAKEFDPFCKESLRELADVQEVIDALTDLLGANPDKLRELQKTVRVKRGDFTKRVFVDTVTLADDDPWVEYYACNPERFPELRS